jgi:hypothetical protein
VKLRLAILLAAVAAGFGVAGCGDDDSGDETTTPSISIPSVTIPTAPTTTAPSGGVAPETTTSSGSGRGNYDPAQPDTPENDVPPPPGSPQEAFEQMCEQNPAACG